MHLGKTPRVLIRFYEELNDFLPSELRKLDIEPLWEEGLLAGELIQSMGVPCAAVDLVLVNGDSVGFDYELRPGDRVSVYPVFESLPIHDIARIPGRPLARPRWPLP